MSARPTLASTGDDRRLTATEGHRTGTGYQPLHALLQRCEPLRATSAPGHTSSHHRAQRNHAFATRAAHYRLAAPRIREVPY